MNELTDISHWNEYWKSANLPIVVNVEDDVYDNSLDQLFRRYLKTGDKKYLEIGCGSSKWLIYFYERFGYDVYGTDYSKVACRVSKLNLRMRSIFGTVICSDIFSSCFRKEKFDVVFTGGLIEHFRNPVDILRVMKTLLGEGGILITSIPNIESIYWDIQRIIDKRLFQAHHKISMSQLGEYYQKAGLILDCIRYVGSFDLFSIDWSSVRSKHMAWRYLGMPLIGKLNGGINRVLRRFSITFESKYLSPFMVAIGHRD